MSRKSFKSRRSHEPDQYRKVFITEAEASLLLQLLRPVDAAALKRRIEDTRQEFRDEGLKIKELFIRVKSNSFYESNGHKEDTTVPAEIVCVTAKELRAMLDKEKRDADQARRGAQAKQPSR